MILVVGATGQLGSAVLRRLSDDGRPVRALVRPTSPHDDLAALPGVEVVAGDLRDRASLERALDGVSSVVATANTVAPRPGDDRREILDRGYGDLVTAAEAAGVDQFVLVSLPLPDGDLPPEFHWKRVNEQRIVASGMSHTILKFPMFTEVWLSLSGSSIPERGEPRSTLQRPFAFTRRFRRITGRMVEDRGRLLVNGSADHRQAFISVRDVAAITAAAVGHPAARDRVVEIGGPEVLDWHDVAATWTRLLGRPVKVTVTPAAVFRLNAWLMGPFAPDAANIMALNAMAARLEGPWEPGPFVEELGVGPLQTVEETLRDKLDLPA